MRKARASSPVPRRTHWKETVGSLIFVEIDYGAGTQSAPRTLARVDDEADGMFVASLCGDGMHAPALDVDFPVDVRNARFGRPTVCFRHEVPKAAYLRLLEVLRDIGLIAPSWARSTIGRIATSETARMQPEIELKVPVRVLPSSTDGHFHLYIDAAIAPSAHTALLGALQAAGIIGADFHAMAQRNGMTLLIKPGVTKRDLAPRTPAAPRWESSY